VQKICLKDHKYKKPITKRPADLLEPELDKAREAVKHITKDTGDVLTYALYPTTGMRFLRWKHGLEEPPAEVKPKTLEQAKREQELVAKAKKGLLVEPPAKPGAPERTAATRRFNVFVDGEYFAVDVDPADGGAPAVRPAVSAPARAAAAPAAAATAPPASAAPSAHPGPAPSGANGGTAPAIAANGAGAVSAPMPGIIVEYRVAQGDSVKAGDVVLVLEAMKMQNEITAEVGGTVATVTHKAGDEVLKGDVLLVIEP
jgi:biotin carboxyl carrier protein